MQKEKHIKRKLAVASLSAFPTAFTWASGETLYFPFMLSLSLSASTISAVWLISPCLGLFLHAPFGRWSDHCTSPWGRRRPFFVVISVLGALCLILVAFSPELAEYISPDHKVSTTAIIAFVGYGFVDVSHDLLLGPSRALVNDLVPDDHLDLADVANSYYTLISVLGALASLVVCSLPWLNIRYVFSIAAFMATGISMLLLFAVKEVPYRPSVMVEVFPDDDDDEDVENNDNDNDNDDVDPPALEALEEDSVANDSETQSLIKPSSKKQGQINPPTPAARKKRMTAIEQLRALPLRFYTLWVATAMGWLLNVIVSNFWTSFVATSICKGVADGTDEQKEAFDRGIRYGAISMGLHYIVGMATTVMLPRINKIVGMRKMFYFGELLMGATMMPMLWIPQMEDELVRVLLSGGLLVCAGVFFATHYENPFSIAENDKENEISQKNRGFIVALLTMSLTIMQMFTPVVGQIVDRVGHGDIAYGIVFPAVALLGVDIVLVLVEIFAFEKKRRDSVRKSRLSHPHE